MPGNRHSDGEREQGFDAALDSGLRRGVTEGINKLKRRNCQGALQRAETNFGAQSAKWHEADPNFKNEQKFYEDEEIDNFGVLKLMEEGLPKLYFR